MIAKSSKDPNVFGYDVETDQDENKSDVKELYHRATSSKPTRKLVVFGGLHGLDPTGVPSGQEPDEKQDIRADDAVVTVNNVRVTTFALDDIAMKKATALNFIYKNLGQYTTAGSDMSPQKQAEIVTLIKGYSNSGNYLILLAWCFSSVWARNNGL